jgi:hypothetical protein
MLSHTYKLNGIGQALLPVVQAQDIFLDIDEHCMNHRDICSVVHNNMSIFKVNASLLHYLGQYIVTLMFGPLRVKW